MIMGGKNEVELNGSPAVQEHVMIADRSVMLSESKPLNGLALLFGQWVLYTIWITVLSRSGASL